MTLGSTSLTCVSGRDGNVTTETGYINILMQRKYNMLVIYVDMKFNSVASMDTKHETKEIELLELNTYKM